MLSRHWLINFSHHVSLAYNAVEPRLTPRHPRKRRLYKLRYTIL